MLLVVLWVRSYRWRDNLHGGNGITLTTIQSYRGEFGVGRWAIAASVPWQWDVKTIVIPDESSERLWWPMEDLAPLSYVGIRWQTLSGLHLFAVQYLSLETLSAMFAVLPWLRWQFSLRTLLIAMTLIAVVLTVVAWIMR